MTSEDITLQQSPSDLGAIDVPLKENMGDLSRSFTSIWSRTTIQDKAWLDIATQRAREQMISDRDDVILEAREVLKSARKQMGWRRYIWLLT